jgi:hypothetical protein
LIQIAGLVGCRVGRVGEIVCYLAVFGSRREEDRPAVPRAGPGRGEGAGGQEDHGEKTAAGQGGACLEDGRHQGDDFVPAIVSFIGERVRQRQQVATAGSAHVEDAVLRMSGKRHVRQEGEHPPLGEANLACQPSGLGHENAPATP